MRNIFLLLFFLYNLSTVSQQVTYNNRISWIIHKNCTPCHQSGEAAPFKLITYNDLVSHAKLIDYVICNFTMPPWKADRNYSSFHTERGLSSVEIEQIKNWIKDGCILGQGKESTKNIMADIAGLGKPDLIVQMHKPYKIKPGQKDYFVTFVEKICLPEDKYISAVKVVPGNMKLVHHCRIWIDTNDLGFNQLINNEGFFNTNDRSTPFHSSICGYVPGISPFVYPKNFSKKIPKNCYLLIDIHYQQTPIEDIDQTMVYLYFHKKKDTKRIVMGNRFVVDHITSSKDTNIIPKDVILSLTYTTSPTLKDVSLLAIEPHMHMIGKSIKIYATTVTFDTIPLIFIPDWDFYWQDIYYFKKLIKIPSGSIFHFEVCYDNTNQNIRNPNIPPQDVFFRGDMSSKNEMCQLLIEFAEYMDGDENIEPYK
jgi:hypothetical protein